MKFTKKNRKKIVKDYLDYLSKPKYQPKKISKKEQDKLCPELLRLQNETSKAVSSAFKNAVNIDRRRFKT